MITFLFLKVMHGYPLPPYLTPLFPIPAYFCKHFRHTHSITNSSICSPWGSHPDCLFLLSPLALAGGALLLWCLVIFDCELTFDWSSSLGVLGTRGEEATSNISKEDLYLLCKVLWVQTPETIVKMKPKLIQQQVGGLKFSKHTGFFSTWSWVIEMNSPVSRRGKVAFPDLPR